MCACTSARATAERYTERDIEDTAGAIRTVAAGRGGTVSAAPASLLVGAARIDITPPLDVRYLGFARNLADYEIVEQLLHLKAGEGGITHVVFMGMGEPLLNLEAVRRAADRKTGTLYRHLPPD